MTRPLLAKDRLRLLDGKQAKRPTSRAYLVASRARLVGQGSGDNAQRLQELRKECVAFLRDVDSDHPFGGRRAA